MAEAEMRRLGTALMLGLMAAVATSSCGGESKTDVNEDVVTGGKSSNAGGAGTGGVQATGGAASGGTKASGGTISGVGGSLVQAGSPATGGAATGGASTGGSKATGGASPASGGTASGGMAPMMGGRASLGGRASTMGGRASTMGGGGGMGGAVDLPDDSCLMDCEVSAAGNPMCGESFTWVCFGGDTQVLDTPECMALPTQVPRFCCSRDFRPCE
jgi:hypothetical protein